ncbi:MAG TPA: PQQ-dependent dehydrogenase, methanol/ethanol family [Bryobacteraceae bacterium]|nr:PQQ-dependent dehydrogenase, methanol/ethanol family [Bryobacteraceae bacterium]
MRVTIFLLLVGVISQAQVTFERLRHAESEPGNWLTYSGNYSAHRYSAIDQINTQNIGHLRPSWVYQLDALDKAETTPLVVDGVMYITESPSNVIALDTRTGRALWSFRRPVPKDVRICCGQVNRGVAVLDDLVFVGTVDARLIALDAKTGSVRWNVAVADYKTGHAITAAPLALKDKIVVGMAGGEFGVRGFLDAYDAKTGKQAWRFWTVPVKGDPGSETWAGESWKNGAATTWITGSYDPDLNVLYWGTGNPGPDWNGDVRSGDNLYSDCLIALDADTGKLKWHFQFTPHDVWDIDATEIPVLVDGVFREQQRKLVLFANRNAFYYVLDRQTGQFLHAKQYAKQTWATQLDDRGRPVPAPGAQPTETGVKVYPHSAGGTNWFSPSYSPKTNLFYLAARESGGVVYKGEAEYRPGAEYNGGGLRNIPGEPGSGAVRALEPMSGELRWEYPLFSPPWAGVLSTAGGLVFGGCDEGYFFALDAASGKPLWRFQTGGKIISNPMSYLSDGKQRVAIAAGHAIYVFGLGE